MVELDRVTFDAVAPADELVGGLDRACLFGSAPGPTLPCDGEGTLVPSAALEALAPRLAPPWRERVGRNDRAKIDGGLHHVPIEVDGWSAFCRTFLVPGEAGGERLAAAAQRFFGLGGRRLFVVRVPRPGEEPELWARGLAPRVVERDRVQAARGLDVLHHLPDVSLVAVPELPDAFGTVEEVPWRGVPPTAVSGFQVCDATRGLVDPGLEAHLELTPLAAPRLDDEGLVRWRGAATSLGEFLTLHRNDLHGLLALPLRSVGRWGVEETAELVDEVRQSDAWGCLMIASPWLRVPLGARGASYLEPPDGSLLGLVAGSSRLRGPWASCAGAALPHAASLSDPPTLEEARACAPLLSLLTARGGTVTLRSEVLCREDPYAARERRFLPAPVGRTLLLVSRWARQAGEELVFEGNGPELWVEVERRAERFLTALYRAGALSGATVEDAFEVRCDQTTMTPNDIDEGRLVLRMDIRPSYPIGTIAVTLQWTAEGRVLIGA